MRVKVGGCEVHGGPYSHRPQRQMIRTSARIINSDSAMFICLFIPVPTTKSPKIRTGTVTPDPISKPSCDECARDISRDSFRSYYGVLVAVAS